MSKIDNNPLISPVFRAFDNDANSIKGEVYNAIRRIANRPFTISLSPAEPPPSTNTKPG